MNDSATIQQIVDKISSSSNVLIAVSDSPTLDALSAAIALALTLNKLDKHGTAVFSGKVPPSLTFLNPEKTLEPNTNSLRDFIISLDKQKADHLRYKIEGDFVKIYITPYRTTINKEDLEFTVGNLNMDLVIALGVYDNKHLDNALFVHGRVLHDSTIISLSKGEPASKIGTIEWHEADASSLCEMVEAIIEPFNTEKKVMDKQIATALLTGIVAETDRFANEKTNANSMTVAAKLMAAGANQQLIAAKLSIDHPTINPPDLKVELSKRLTEDKESVQQFIVDHKDDTLEEITNTVKDKPSSAVFNRENNLASPAVEVEPSVKVDHKDIAMDTSEPQINLQESAVVSPAENIDSLEPKTKIIEPTKDFIESSVVNPPMSASMVTPLVSKPDIFEKPPSAFDSMVFNPNPAGVAPANVNPVSTLNQQPSNVANLNQTTPTNVSNEQAALAAVHASFDGVPTLPLPPPVPNFTQSQSPSPVAINPAYSTEQTPQTKPQNPTDPTQFQIPV